MAPGKRSGKVDEVMAGATEKVLKQITELYETGLSGATGGSLGLKVRSSLTLFCFGARAS